QQGSTASNRYGAQSGVGFDWTINKYNNLSGDINYNKFGNKSSGIISQAQQIVSFNDSAVSNMNVENNVYNKFKFHSTDANINYKRTFAKEDQSLEIDLSTSLGNNNVQ